MTDRGTRKRKTDAKGRYDEVKTTCYVQRVLSPFPWIHRATPGSAGRAGVSRGSQIPLGTRSLPRAVFPGYAMLPASDFMEVPLDTRRCPGGTPWASMLRNDDGGTRWGSPLLNTMRWRGYAGSPYPRSLFSESKTAKLSRLRFRGRGIERDVER